MIDCFVGCVRRECDGRRGWSNFMIFCLFLQRTRGDLAVKVCVNERVDPSN